MILALTAPFFAAPNAIAQTADPACMMKNSDGTETIDMTKCPDGKTIGSTVGQTELNGAAAPATETTASTDPAKTPAPDITIAPEVFASSKIISANDFIGKRIYSSANEDIGEVNDLIISDSGNVRAVIVGVGGFLGIGGKNVAVNMASLTLTPDGNSVKLMLNATKDQLTSAPQYDSATRSYVTK